MSKIIEVSDLSLKFNIKVNNTIHEFFALKDINLEIYQGDMVGIIGESGSGKSTLALSILNLIQSPGEITKGDIVYLEKDNILTMDPAEMQGLRWKEIATVFQAAQNALNPILKVQDHFDETWIAHKGSIDDSEEYRRHIRNLLSKVRLDESVLDKYSFELSGGQKQRVLIALSLLLEPKIILLDEPTTALDVINQWYILEILKTINEDLGVTLVFMTHDISIIGSLINRLVVMYAGQIVEVGNSKEIYADPRHPYTKDLLASIPSLYDDFENKKHIKGASYDLMSPSDQCRYYERCQLRLENGCKGELENCNKLFELNDNHKVLCFFGGKNE